MNMIKENVTYLLDTLAGYEPEDIEQNEFEVAVNDDQFGQCGIVALAEVASTRIKELEIALNAYAKYANSNAMERDIRLLNK